MATARTSSIRRAGRFLRAEDGAVAVDWVVLTAALTGLGIAVTGIVWNGAATSAGNLGTQASATMQALADIGFSGGSGAGADPGADPDAGAPDGATGLLTPTFFLPTKVLTPGWGPEVDTGWINPADLGVPMPATFEVIGDGNPRAQDRNGQTVTSGNVEWGTILRMDTPACGASHTVQIVLNGGASVGQFTVERPAWPDTWGAPPPGC